MLEPVPSPEDQTIDPAEPSQRVRLFSCSLSRSAGGMSTVTVEYSLPESSDRHQAKVSGTASQAGDLRLAALATLEAVSVATNKVFSAELIGVKPLRAFDSTFVVVALLGRIDGTTRRLVGAAIADEDQNMGVALATLQAVNRIVAPLIVRRGAEQ